jgi:MoaA/NifB/PqqE/SkfB family radical SAM enzyme
MGKFIFFNRKGLNIDITHRCALECLRCQRTTTFTSKGKKVPGEDMPLKEFEKVIKHFKKINFCGQYSDPVHHPNFIEMLKMCYKNNIQTLVHNASSTKSKEWYIEAFKTNVNARWVFGIDGLPETSCSYRVNQDGVKLFNIMIDSKKYLLQLPLWQMIVFSFNENDIDKCKKIADDNNIPITILQSSRWNNDNDPLMPKNIKYKMKRI